MYKEMSSLALVTTMNFAFFFFFFVLWTFLCILAALVLEPGLEIQPS